MRRIISSFLRFVGFAWVGTAYAQAPAEATEAKAMSDGTTLLSRVVSISGVLKDKLGKPLRGVQGVTLALYKEQEGGAPLWLETQNVTADEQGRFTALLGATKPDGLPLDLFSTDEARWLGVQANQPGEVEQARVLLVSVPYALKAADAETLGGKPASAYVLADPSRDREGAVAATSSDGSRDGGNVAAVNSPVDTPGGTANYLPKFTDADTIANSQVFDNGTGVGIGTTAAAAKLHVKQGANGINDGIVLESASTINKWVISMGSNANEELMITRNLLGSTLFTILAGGNVGIGTITPGQKLEVAGNVKVTGTPGTNGVIFPDATTQTTAMRTAALTRGITYIAGCNWCGTLADTNDQPQIYYNVVGAMTINSVTCFSDVGAPTINIARNGANIVAPYFACSTAGVTTAVSSPLNLNDTLDFVMVTAGGSAHRVTVTIKATLN